MLRVYDECLSKNGTIYSAGGDPNNESNGLKTGQGVKGCGFESVENNTSVNSSSRSSNSSSKNHNGKEAITAEIEKNSFFSVPGGPIKATNCQWEPKSLKNDFNSMAERPWPADTEQVIHNGQVRLGISEEGQGKQCRRALTNEGLRVFCLEERSFVLLMEEQSLGVRLHT